MWPQVLGGLNPTGLHALRGALLPLLIPWQPSPPTSASFQLFQPTGLFLPQGLCNTTVQKQHFFSAQLSL